VIFDDRLFDDGNGHLARDSRYAARSIARDTALRDITDLLQRGLLRKNEAGGRSTSYSLAEGPAE
jgi:Fic family protein